MYSPKMNKRPSLLFLLLSLAIASAAANPLLRGTVRFLEDNGDPEEESSGGGGLTTALVIVVIVIVLVVACACACIGWFCCCGEGFCGGMCNPEEVAGAVGGD